MVNAVGTQFSSPQYAQLNANVAGLQARVSQLLASGEIPTAATAGAQAIVSGNTTVQGMFATLNQIDKEAKALQINQAEVTSGAYNNLQNAAGNTGSSGSFQQGQTAAGGAIVWDGSKWVAK